MELDKSYWQYRYQGKNTPWDIGHVSPPLKSFMDELDDSQLRVLIPGAGNAHEAIYLHKKGFDHVFVCDWVEESFEYLLAEAPDFPSENLLCMDFFELDGIFDLVLEQTFFCAIPPSLRGRYMSKMASLLPSGGTLAGLLFASPFEKEGPPFGGTEMEYRKLFSDDFDIECLKIAENSILPRANNELFFKLNRK